MTKEQTLAYLEKIKDKVNRASELYYSGVESFLSDHDFDRYMEQIKEIEKLYPEYKTIDSPSQRVGSKAPGFHKVTHQYPMLSLNNIFPQENDLFKELKDWVAKIEKLLPDETIMYCVEPKFDGLAVELVYRDSVLISASTRGDGLQGEDIIKNINTIVTVPKTLNRVQRGIIVVYGEVMLANDKFQIALKEGKEYSNPRNAAAGMLLSKKPLENNVSSPLAFIPYGMKTEGVIHSQTDALNELKMFGFYLDFDEYVFTTELKDIEKLYQHIKDNRLVYRGKFGTDGLVIKVNSTVLQEQLGVASTYPKYAIAFKFPNKEGLTRVEGVEHYVGRTGQITPVAKISPIVIDGVEIRNVNLHNYVWVKEKDIHVGDTVTVSRAGDVIPHVTSVKSELRIPGQQKRIVAPKKCPFCETVTKNVGGKHYCVKALDNARYGKFDEICEYAYLESLIYFVSRECMNIEGLGPEHILALYKTGWLAQPSNLYVFGKERLGKMLFDDNSGKNKTAIKIEKSLKESLKLPLYRFILSLNIPRVGVSTAKLIANLVEKTSGCMLDNLNIKKEYLLALRGVGEETAEAYCIFMESFYEQKMNERWKKIGYQPKAPVQRRILSNRLKGKIFTVTGSFPEHSREEIKNLIETHSGIFTNNLNIATSHLIVGSKPSSKLTKAKKRAGLKVITLDEFLQLIN